MKSADLIAAEILDKWNDYENPQVLLNVISKAITAYAEEIKEDRDRWADSSCRLEKAQEKIKQQVRAEALEEAAKVFDTKAFVEECADDGAAALFKSEPFKRYAAEIRALKNLPDNNCFTLEDGSCVSKNCTHNTEGK